jgi:protein-disulfide isomerase
LRIDTKARIVITEFMDFQCAWCKRLIPRVDSIKREFAEEIAIVVHHFPLDNHRWAIPAAIAAECAHRQDRFAAMYRLLFAQQDSFGLKTWTTYAVEAKVPDMKAFETCSSLPADSFPRIASGRELGQRTGVTGTPTVWINGNVLGTNGIGALRTGVARFARASVGGRP